MRLAPALLFAVLPLVFLVAVAIFQLTIALPEASLSRAETAASFQTLRDVSAVDEAVQDAERGQRGFLVTGRDSYLEPYDHAKEILPALMGNLSRDVSGDGDQQGRLLSLQADLTTKMNELAATIATFRSSGFNAAKAIVDTDVCRDSMIAVTDDLAAIADAESALLRTRSAQQASADRNRRFEPARGPRARIVQERGIGAGRRAKSCEIPH